jgi:predicted DNA-binding transcriptional regulator AlpA
MSERFPERLLNEKEAAELLRVSQSFLRKKRVTGDGPEYIRIGRAIRYHPSKVEQFQQANTWNSTSQY